MIKLMKTVLTILFIGGISFTVYRTQVKKAADPNIQNAPVTTAADSAKQNESGQAKTEQANTGHSATSEANSPSHAVNVPTVGAPVGAPVGIPKAAPVKPDSNCFSFEYKHQKEAQNKDIEEFLDYSNAFPILHDNVAQKSICVKVNNKPVAFKMSKYKNQQEVVIGSVVGPESLIKVSYCVGKATCKEACAVKSKSFMDDMMSDAGDEDEFKDSWGDGKEQKKDLQAKVKEFRSVASENKDLQKQSTIRTWDTVQKNDWVCKK